MRQPTKRTWARLVLFAQLIMLTATLPIVVFAQDSTPDATADSSAAAQALGVAHGAYLRPVFIDNHNGTWTSYGDEVLAYDSFVGKDLAVLMYFLPFSPLDPFLLNEIQRRVPSSRRPVIMITWEPSSNSTGCDLGYGDGQGPLRAINAGRCDQFIREYARTLKGRPERFIIRFAHEMNITDYPWWPGRYGLDPSSYVAMFRRVRDIYRSEGATNVEFMWSPNYASNPPDAWNHLSNYYPGDAYVDWIGLSGYNWNRGAVPWRDPEWLYDGVLKDLACRYAKPVIIAEVGTVNGANESDKANWITRFYDMLDDYPFVRGVVWFNDFAYARRGESDFRATTGTQDCYENHDCSGVQALPGAAGQQATNAYINSIRQGVISTKLPSLAQATPPYTLCSAPSQPFSLSASTITVRPGGTTSVTLRGFMYPSASQISFDLPSGLRGAASPAALQPPWGTATLKLSADSKLSPGVYNGTIRVGSMNLPVTVKNLKVRAFIPDVRQ